MSITEYLGRSLLGDVKLWATQLITHTGKVFARRRFDTIDELGHALHAGDVHDGAEVEVYGRLTSFGAFDRRHFLPAMIGFASSDRRGPPILASNLPMAAIGQMTNHLKPVALFPPLGQGVNQGVVLPAATSAIGFVGLIAGLTPEVPSLNALYADRHLALLNQPTRIRAVARVVGPAAFEAAGYQVEAYEALRQLGQIWVLDITGEHALVEPLKNSPVPDLWGGLYAEGHLEYEGGTGPREQVVHACKAAFEKEGIAARIVPNRAGRKDVSIIAQGVRMLIDGQVPIWSLHADCELTKEYASSLQMFDSLTVRLLRAIADAFDASGVPLVNRMDVDFTYSRSAASFKVLSSRAAEAVDDPLVLAIREWHRLRTDHH